MKKITIIIPSYNEEKNVRPFYDEVLKYLTNKNYEFELLYVNDGSKDNTLLEMRKLHNEDPHVNYISFSRNFGKESAMHAGLIHAKDSDAVIIIDCDLQQPPSLIPEMISYYEEGYKIVYTKGKTRKGEPKIRTFFANWFYRIYNTHTDMPLDNGAKDFQLLDKVVVDAFLKLNDNYRFVKGIFSWVGYKRKCLEYDFIPRMNGKSSWSFKSLLRYAFNGMNQFSTILMVVPVFIILMSIVLLVSDGIFLFFNIFTLSEFLLGIYSFIILFLLGIISYAAFYLLYQMRRQVLNRPIFLIEETSEDSEVD